MADYLIYWRPETVETSDPAEVQRYAASDWFRDDVRPGDVVWAVTSPAPNELRLVARIVVERVVHSRAEAMAVLGNNIWRDSEHFVIGSPENSRTIQDIDLSEVVPRVTFEGGVDRLPGGFTGRNLQRMRRLTLESTAVLQSAWDSVRPALPLVLHERYGRREIYASVGDSYTPQDQNKNTGLSPRCPDDGYFLFITLDKAGFDPAYDYADELGLDWFRWTTRRDRGSDHPDYVRLRQPTTRLSLFVRNRERDGFAYLGEVDHVTHREFREERQGKVQQEYLFRLRIRVPEELYADLAANVDVPRRNRPAGTTPPNSRSRRAAAMDAMKQALSYALGRLERNVVPAHHNYQVRLRQFFDAHGIRSEWERDFVDVRFELEGALFIGEIKVTTSLRLEEAFRSALGQLLEYSFIRFDPAPPLVMFLDRQLDAKRTALASRLGIAVVCEIAGVYRLLNPDVHPTLGKLFVAGDHQREGAAG